METVVFLCVENSCRSQIAEAFANKYGKNKVTALSAGSRPSGNINENAIHLMKEFGCDLTKQKSTGISDLPKIEFHSIVSMGCGDRCPSIKTKRRIEWNIRDPKEMKLDEFSGIIEEIKIEVLNLLASI
tara:strand:- start:3277 stop:3663 length:387 start_codon:yes stop_codon:yes gene_type:complete